MTPGEVASSYPKAFHAVYVCECIDKECWMADRRMIAEKGIQWMWSGIKSAFEQVVRRYIGEPEIQNTYCLALLEMWEPEFKRYLSGKMGAY
jgi:hypothetical protein